MKNYRLAVGLCMAADKYMIVALKQLCIKKLTDDLSPQHVCQVHEVATALNLFELEEQALKVFCSIFCPLHKR
jgi:hypothetical protein